jgi:hypothetical protein
MTTHVRDVTHPTIVLVMVKHTRVVDVKVLVPVIGPQQNTRLVQLVNVQLVL